MDEKDKLLTVGQFAKLCNVTTKTLRYYDAIHLLHPVMVSEENGYRYYMKKQTTTILLVKQLQSLGISLTDITEYMNQNNREDVIHCLQALLDKQQEQLQIELQHLQDQQKKINSLHALCDRLNDQSSIQSFHYRKLDIKKGRTIIYKVYEGKYHDNIFRDIFSQLIRELQEAKIDLRDIDGIPVAVIYACKAPDHVVIKAGYELKAESNLGTDTEFHTFELVTLEKGSYISYRYEGDYPSLRQDLYSRMEHDITEMGLQIMGPFYLKFYISEAMTPKTENFSTEIQVLVGDSTDK